MINIAPSVIMEEKEEKRLSLLVRLSFGMGNMLNVLGVVGMWFPYASAFFTKVLSLSGNQAGTILLVAQVAGGVFAPLVGILSDMCKTPCYGRRKVFHLVGVLSFVCSFFFLWHNCFGCSGRDATLYYSLIAIIFQFGYAATQISQLALVPELAPNRHAKVELNSIRLDMTDFIQIWLAKLKMYMLQICIPGRRDFADVCYPVGAVRRTSVSWRKCPQCHFCWQSSLWGLIKS